MTQDMLTNAVSTGNSWSPPRVIPQSIGRNQKHQGDANESFLPSTKALSANMGKGSSSPSLAAVASSTASLPPRGSNESVFDYLLRTGVPAPVVDEMRLTNRMQSRQLRPIVVASSSSSSSVPSPSVSVSPSRLLDDRHQQSSYSPSPMPMKHVNASHVMHTIQSLLSTAPSPSFNNNVHSQQQQQQQPYYQRRSVASPPALSPLRPQDEGGKKYYGSLTPQPIMRAGPSKTVREREFDVSSMARTPAPYL